MLTNNHIKFSRLGIEKLDFMSIELEGHTEIKEKINEIIDFINSKEEESINE